MAIPEFLKRLDITNSGKDKDGVELGDKYAAAIFQQAKQQGLPSTPALLNGVATEAPAIPFTANDLAKIAWTQQAGEQAATRPTNPLTQLPKKDEHKLDVATTPSNPLTQLPQLQEQVSARSPQDLVAPITQAPTQQNAPTQEQPKNDWLGGIVNAIPGIAKGALEFAGKPEGLKTFSALMSDPYLKEALLNRGNELEKLHLANKQKEDEYARELKMYAEKRKLEREMPTKMAFSTNWIDPSTKAPLKEDEFGTLYNADGTKFSGTPKKFEVKKANKVEFFQLSDGSVFGTQYDPYERKHYDINGDTEVQVPLDATPVINPQFNPVSGSVAQLTLRGGAVPGAPKVSPPKAEKPKVETPKQEAPKKEIPKEKTTFTFPSQKQMAQELGKEWTPKFKAQLDEKTIAATNDPSYSLVSSGLNSVRSAIIRLEENPELYRDIASSTLGVGEAGMLKKDLANGVDALLRPRTGAAMPPSEFNRYRQVFSGNWYNDPDNVRYGIGELLKGLQLAETGMSNPLAIEWLNRKQQKEFENREVPKKGNKTNLVRPKNFSDAEWEELQRLDAKYGGK